MLPFPSLSALPSPVQAWFDRTLLAVGHGLPDWFHHEMRNRLILLINHVLKQEPVAMQRLALHGDKRILLQWADVAWGRCVLRVSRVGLFEHLANHDGGHYDLQIGIKNPSSVKLIIDQLQGTKPDLTLEGDVQLAAELAWLGEHLRWDVEDDLARWVGDGTAHILRKMAQTLMLQLNAFIGKKGDL